nr:MAG TPA: hypothetical protein [Bacteriophage sp.]
MKKIIEEQKSKLQPFPFMEDESYLLKLKTGNYVVVYWKMENLLLNLTTSISKKKSKVISQ